MIKLISVDDRLLHGQIAFYWAKYFKLKYIVVLNDEAANDEFTKMILGLAKPHGVNLIVEEIEKGYAIVKEHLISNDNTLIIVGSLFDAEKILIKIDDIKTINIGGLRTRPNSKTLNERISLTVEDIAICRRLLDKQIALTNKYHPDDRNCKLSIDILDSLR